MVKVLRKISVRYINAINLPNIITLLRIILLPISLYLFYKEDMTSNILALLLVLIMECSDLIDGFLARKLNKVSDIGKILDPFADHIYRLSFFLFFLLKKIIPLWMFLVCFYRDSLVLNLRIFASSNKNKFVAARKSGKIKAIVQSITIIAIISLTIIRYKIKISDINNIYYLLMYVATFVTLWSAIDYFSGILNLNIKKGVLPGAVGLLAVIILIFHLNIL